MDTLQELELYEGARDELLRRGYSWMDWGHNNDSSPCCLGGALEVAYDALGFNDDPPVEVKNRLLRHLPEHGMLPEDLREMHPDAIGAVSDATYHLDATEVIAALDRAIEECRSKVPVAG